ncbi:MAG TPA: L,D-transpeptidase [Chthoniobacterales bacterium]|jgi:lipoprotein-anchoring transpeptidase ErfK/SrfK|nr:L,D-transpeptidase [Chthoniobacterales bacterium]
MNIARCKIDKQVGRLVLFGIATFVVSCAAPDHRHHIVISTADQKLALLDDGNVAAVYPVSTSKFGLGDSLGSYYTPLGELEIAQKIGQSAPAGMVFKDRRGTGEIVWADAPGRDPIVTRILWLRGLEAQNANAFRRNIYIHGTPEERNIGLPVSYGCIRMRSSDIIHLFSIVGTGTRVTIVDLPMSTMIPAFSLAEQLAKSGTSSAALR